MEGQSSSAEDAPRAIGGVGHGGAPLARRIVVHARAHGVVQPGLDLAIDGRGEDELQGRAGQGRARRHRGKEGGKEKGQGGMRRSMNGQMLQNHQVSLGTKEDN